MRLSNFVEVEESEFYHTFDFPKDSIKEKLDIIKELADTEDPDKDVEIKRICDKILDELK